MRTLIKLNAETGFMQALKQSNYIIFYTPRKGPGGHNVSIETTTEFCDFARKQETDKNHYEEIALSSMEANGFEKSVIEMSKRDGICGWDCGLLEKVIIPGNATCIVLSFDNPDVPAYRSCNVDSAMQASVIFSVMFSYLTEIELGMVNAK